jgi:hypothetical protein
MGENASRTIIVGDVHGCYEELLQLMEKVNYQSSTDRLIFVGDLINKGPQSLDVLEFAENANAEVVVGNHELRFLEYLRNPLVGNYVLHELKHRMGKRLSFWKDYLESMPAFIEEDDFLVVHAGLQPGAHPKDTAIDILTTIRTWDGLGDDLNHWNDPAWFELYEGDKHVVYGHWAANGLTRHSKVTGLDSGCVYGNALSCLIMPENRIVQVGAFSEYALAI